MENTAIQSFNATYDKLVNNAKAGEFENVKPKKGKFFGHKNGKGISLKTLNNRLAELRSDLKDKFKSYKSLGEKVGNALFSCDAKFKNIVQDAQGASLGAVASVAEGLAVVAEKCIFECVIDEMCNKLSAESELHAPENGRVKTLVGEYKAKIQALAEDKSTPLKDRLMMANTLFAQAKILINAEIKREQSSGSTISQSGLNSAPVQSEAPKVETAVGTSIQPDTEGESSVDGAINELKNILGEMGKDCRVEVGDLIKHVDDLRHHQRYGEAKDLKNLIGRLKTIKGGGGTKALSKEEKFSREVNGIRFALRQVKANPTSQKVEISNSKSMEPTTLNFDAKPTVTAQPKLNSAAQPEVKSASVQSEAPKVETAVGTSIQSDTEGEYNIDNAVNALENSLSKEMASRKTSNNYGLDIGNLRNVISDLRNQKNGDKLKELENLVKQFNTRLNNENLHQQTQGRPRLLSRDAGTINRFILSLKNESTPKADSNPEASTVTAQPESTPAPAKPEPGITATLDAPSETTPAAQPEIKPASGQPEKAKPRDTDVSGAASEPKKEKISSSGDKEPEAPTSKEVPSPSTGENKAPENSSFAQRLAFFQNLNK